MKNLLPKTKDPPQGFTLIELMVVISIIAILSVIGAVAYTGIVGRANDSRRMADLKAISDALEVKKGNNATYQPIFVTDFSGGIPTEPTGRAEKYCYTDGTEEIANPAAWTNSACPFGGGNLTSWTVVDYASPPAVNTAATFFRVCGEDQAKQSVICFGSKQ